MGENDNKRQYKNRAGDGDDKNVLEWTVFGISLVLVLSVLLYLVYQVYTQKPSTPDLVVEYAPDPSEHAPQRYKVTIYNKGGETAEEVMIEMVLEKGGEEIEKAEMTLAFAPKESKREGWVIFQEEIAKADTIKSRVVSYKKP